MTTTNPFDLSHTDRLLTTTRSVRKRLDLTRSVPRDVVLDCLRVATQAPSGGNSQRWRWLVIDDPGKKAHVAKWYAASHDPYMAANRELAGDALVAGSSQDRVMDSSSYLSAHMADVPVHVIPCWLDRLPDNPSTMDMAGVYGSLLPAALRSRGLGSAYTTLHLAYENEVGDVLGIPSTVTQAALIPVAYYTGDDFKPAARKPIESVTYWNEWGAKA
jgi:nitroreductase